MAEGIGGGGLYKGATENFKEAIERGKKVADLDAALTRKNESLEASSGRVTKALAGQERATTEAAGSVERLAGSTRTANIARDIESTSLKTNTAAHISNAEAMAREVKVREALDVVARRNQRSAVTTPAGRAADQVARSSGAVSNAERVAAAAAILPGAAGANRGLSSAEMAAAMARVEASVRAPLISALTAQLRGMLTRASAQAIQQARLAEVQARTEASVGLRGIAPQLNQRGGPLFPGARGRLGPYAVAPGFGGGSGSFTPFASTGGGGGFRMGPPNQPPTTPGFTGGFDDDAWNRARLEAQRMADAIARVREGELRAALAAERLTTAESSQVIATRRSAVEMGTLSQQLRRHGALTSEFIAAAARGETTLKELGYQTTVTIGKFAGWTAAATAVFGAFDAIKKLTEGAKDTQNVITNLRRFIPDIDVSRAQTQIRQLAATTNVSIAEVGDAAGQFARVFKNQDDVFIASRAAITATKLDNIAAADSFKYLTAIVQAFKLDAKDLPGIIDEVNAAQREFGAPVAQTLPGIARAAGGFHLGGGTDPQFLESIISTIVRATGASGANVGIAISRSATRFVQTAKNQATLSRFGIDPTAGYQAIIEGVFNAIRTQHLDRQQINQLAQAVGGPAFGGRYFSGLFTNPDLFHDIQRGTSLNTPGVRGSAATELQTVLGKISEQSHSIGVQLGNLGSELGQAGFLRPVQLMLATLNDILRVGGGVVGMFNDMPEGLKVALGVATTLVATTALLRRFNLSEGIARRAPGLAFVDSPDRRLRRLTLSGLGDQRAEAYNAAEAYARQSVRQNIDAEVAQKRYTAYASGQGEIDKLSETDETRLAWYRRRDVLEQEMLRSETAAQAAGEKVLAAKEVAARTEAEIAAVDNMRAAELRRWLVANQVDVAQGFGRPSSMPLMRARDMAGFDEHGMDAQGIPLYGPHTEENQRIIDTGMTRRGVRVQQAVQRRTARVREWIAAQSEAAAAAEVETEVQTSLPNLGKWAAQNVPGRYGGEEFGPVPGTEPYVPPDMTRWAMENVPGRYGGPTGPGPGIPEADWRALGQRVDLGDANMGEQTRTRRAALRAWAQGDSRLAAGLRGMSASMLDSFVGRAGLGAVDRAATGLGSLAGRSGAAARAAVGAFSGLKTGLAGLIAGLGPLDVFLIAVTSYFTLLKPALDKSRDQTNKFEAAANAIPQSAGAARRQQAALQGAVNRQETTGEKIADMFPLSARIFGKETPQQTIARQRKEAQEQLDADAKLRAAQTRALGAGRVATELYAPQIDDQAKKEVKQYQEGQITLAELGRRMQVHFKELKMSEHINAPTAEATRQNLLALEATAAKNVQSYADAIKTMSNKNLQQEVQRATRDLQSFGGASLGGGIGASERIRQLTSELAYRGFTGDQGQMDAWAQAENSLTDAVNNQIDQDLQTNLTLAHTQRERNAAYARAEAAARHTPVQRGAREAYDRLAGQESSARETLQRDQRALNAARRRERQGFPAPRRGDPLRPGVGGNVLQDSPFDSTAKQQGATARDLQRAVLKDRQALEQIITNRQAAKRALDQENQGQRVKVLQIQQQAAQEQVGIIRAQGDLAASKIDPKDSAALGREALQNARRVLSYMKSHRDLFSVTDILEAAATVNQAKFQAAQQTKDDADAIRALQFDIRAARDQGDPRAVAQDMIAKARDEMAHAKTRKDRLQAQLDLVNAQNQAEQAANDHVQARYEYLESLTNDPLKNDRLQIQAARSAVKGTKGADRTRALANVNKLKQQYLQDRVQGREDTIDFNLSMDRITTDQAISDLQALLHIRNMGKAKRREIEQRIHDLKKQSDQEATGFDLDVGSIKLPTAYDVRRAYAPIKALHQQARDMSHANAMAAARDLGTGGGSSAQVVNSPTVIVHVNDRQSAAHVYTAIDRALKTGVRAKMRSARLRG